MQQKTGRYGKLEIGNEIEFSIFHSSEKRQAIETAICSSLSNLF